MVFDNNWCKYRTDKNNISTYEDQPVVAVYYNRTAGISLAYASSSGATGANAFRNVNVLKGIALCERDHWHVDVAQKSLQSRVVT